MPPPVNLGFVEKTVLNFIISTYFGMKNPLPIFICLPGLVLNNPSVYLKLIGVYGSIIGAITTLVALGYTVKYATIIVKKIIKRKKHKPLTPVEIKFIDDVAKDAKNAKKDKFKNVKKFVKRRTGNVTPQQGKVLTKVVKRVKKFKKFKN